MVFFWIMEYIASFVEVSMCCVFCGTFLTKDKLGDKKYVLFVCSAIGAIVIILLNKIEIFSYINSILVLFIVFLLQLFLYKSKVGISILLTLIYTVTLAAVDFMTACFAAILLNTNAEYLLNTQSLSRMICILLSKSLLVLIIITFSILLKKSLMFTKRYVLIMCLYSIFLLVSLFVTVELNMNNENPSLELFLTIFLLFQS